MTRLGFTSCSMISVTLFISVFVKKFSVRVQVSSSISKSLILSISSPLMSLAITILRELAAHVMISCTFKSLSKHFSRPWICFMSTDPISPVEPRTAILAVVAERVKAMCAARRARLASSALTTTATCRSLDPCAIKRMFTLALANELMKVAETPEVSAMPSPTMATMAMPVTKLNELMVLRDNSSSKASSRASMAFCPSFSGTATVMLYSLLA
mmetsp:Transcript_13072/g.15934  ORF Transcript_13072/g.15934 Transcript_13072/m.15934 type:complete len:214 (-) Transcript_13072:549-1190(-)